MDEKLLKTSLKQRIIISIIAILLLGSTIATYVAIVAANGGGSDDSSELETRYSEKAAEMNTYAATLSDQYFDEFSSYKSRIKSYNAESANSTGVKKNDLKEGTGKELASGDTDYFAYYIGWCPDESVFDSSLDDVKNPTSLKNPLYAGQGLIAGWNQGVIGMKIGGIREITIPGELAYGDSQEICGTTNSPLKFIVMVIEDDKLSKLNTELNDIYSELINSHYPK